MPKGFQKGNQWRFQPNNKHGTGGSRPGAGRKKDFNPEEERLIRLCPMTLRSKAYWYVISRLKIRSMQDPNWTNHEIRNHKFFIRVFRQGYGGGRRLASMKRFYLKR